MHPAVRVLVLLVLASALPAMSAAALALLGALSALLYFRFAPDALDRLRTGLLRLRWLLLAIFVLYVGCTQGEPLFAALPGLSREGLAEGTRRALVLIDLLTMVYLLLALTPVHRLASAICLLLGPLRWAGVDPARVGLRLALALDAVGEMHARFKAVVHHDQGARASPWQRAAALVEQIETQAGAAAVTVPATDDNPAPHWWEWPIPVLLAVALHTWTP
ncbi:hypothetical protein AAG565_02420 [Fontimonas sp. SYSU GA230001]|uniref:hypothetical protein n=1 Tax=Fontimonas sp. SYSU GA230001 TaxID=3142450 RepID=UPI0032B60ADC